jgi:lysophospholipase L1-like esterase
MRTLNIRQADHEHPLRTMLSTQRFSCVVLVLTLFVAGCGGGGDSAPAQPSAPTGAVVVVIYGDSTTKALCETLTLNGHCPASVAQPLLPGVALRQEGAGGSTSRHLLLGTDGVHIEAFDRVAAASGADVMVFRFGTNDANLLSLGDFHSHMEMLVSIGEGLGIKVVIQTPTPVWGRSDLGSLDAYVQVLRNLAALHPKAMLCDLYAMTIEGGDAHEVDSGGVHRTDVGITKDGERTAGCIRQAVGQ